MIFFVVFLFILDLELPHKIKNEKILSNRFDLSEMKCEAPIDLSRRCDSVETRKTPSPYNSSAFGGESSPSLLNESPSSLIRSNSSGSNFDGQLPHNNRAVTPNRYLQSAAYIQRSFSTASTTCHNSSKYSYESDRSPSPEEESMPLHHPTHSHSHHRYMRDQQIAMLNGNEDELNRFLHAFALQKLQNIPATALAGVTENDNAITADALPFPMMLGRDGKVARPFKAYSSDPLSIAAAIPASDSLIHRMSTERYNLYREEMMKKICEANGGRPTITNPKMRRTSHRGNGPENDQSIDAEKPQQQQQHKQNVALSLDQSHGIQADSNDTNRSGKEPIKDNAYFERRRKNNAAAKKSRDRRRIKEDEIAIRAAFLERENLELKFELAAAKRQLASFLEK